jgi:hypothetical protein
VGRVVAVLLIAAGVVSGCGSSSSSSPSSRGTIDSLLKRPGPDVAVTAGAGSFVPGSVRFPFLVIDNSAKPVERPTARVWVATGRNARPFASTTAQLEPIGVPGRSAPAAGNVTKIYVAHFRIPRPGRYWLVAVPERARIQAVSVFKVVASLPVPKVGAKAPASATPTLGSEPVSALTTDVPPDRALLRDSVAGSLAVHKPFVVTFATPRFCTSRVCGPVVDVVQSVARRFPGSGIRFIHVEVYRDNDPTKGYNRWMREWGLTSEPWTFLVGRDGRIKAEFEGSVSAAELTRAIRTLLNP